MTSCYHQQVTWTTEDELLRDMESWDALPDEDDPRWADAEPPGPVWDGAKRLLAAVDECGARGWTTAAIRAYTLMADWDCHGVMLSMRHGFERAFMHGPDDDAGSVAFALALEPLTTHERAGTRLWAVAELGVLRELSSLSYVVDRLDDEHPAVAEEARSSLVMLAQRHVEAELECLVRDVR